MEHWLWVVVGAHSMSIRIIYEWVDVAMRQCALVVIDAGELHGPKFFAKCAGNEARRV